MSQAEAPIKLSVHSEIGELRHVLVHEPGAEVDLMTPAVMEEMLFDDIVYGDLAREEHRRFRAVIEAFGAEVHDTQDLLLQTLSAVPEAAVSELLDDIDEEEGLGARVRRRLSEMDPKTLATQLIAGSLKGDPGARGHHMFDLAPLPNMLMARDAQVVLGDGVLISWMNRRARRREPLLSRFVFKNHPRLKQNPLVADFVGGITDEDFGPRVRPSLEGGDVLLLKEGIVLVGVSERTQERAVDRLCDVLRGHAHFHTLVMVPMPHARSQMHLDTIFTRLDHEDFLVYPPMVRPASIERLSAIRVDLTREGHFGERHLSLSECLAGLLKPHGVVPRFLHCGGKQYVNQSREQWTDGSNSFCLRPGVVLLYKRNIETARMLGESGYRVIDLDREGFDEASGRCTIDFTQQERMAILLPGGELPRARGGPRCMTMPLERASI